MTILSYRTAGLATLLTCLPLVVAGQPQESHQDIRIAAEQHARTLLDDGNSDIQLSANRLDSRLRLAKCSQNLDTFSKNFQRIGEKVTIGVRCNDEKGWTLYVPVTAAIYKDVVVVDTPVSRNEIIDDSDLTVERRNIASARKGFFTSKAQLIGKKAKRALRSGQLVGSNMVTTPKAIKRGNKVTILAATGNISVRMSGKALGNGAPGERIRVINTRSEREIEATVIGPGLVRVTL